MILQRVIYQAVHCHIGSLEKWGFDMQNVIDVHCHIGSLENAIGGSFDSSVVHCHIGSLERYDCKYV